MTGDRQGAATLGRRPATALTARVATARRSRPTGCSRARSSDLGFVTTEGYEHLLEIARQSVPDGYGNSYFWVKPPRIVPADRVRTVGGRLAFDGERDPAVRRGVGARRGREFFRDAGIDTIGVCFLHSYANPAHERAMRDVLARVHPDAVVSISSRRAARVPRVRAGRHDPRRRRREARHPRLRRQHHRAPAATRPTRARRPGQRAVLRDEVQRRRAVAPTRSSTSRSRRCCPGPRPARSAPRSSPRRPASTEVVTCDGGGTSTDVTVVVDGEPALTTEGTVGALPEQDPDDRRRHGRRRRRLDRLGLARGHAEGRAAVGRRRPGPDVLRHAAATEPTITDAHLVLGRIPPHLLGGEVPLDVEPARAGHRRAGRPARTGLGGVRRRRPGDLRVEPGQRAAPDHGQARPRRPRLHAGDVRRLRVAAGLPAGRHPRPARRRWCRSTPATCRRTACSPSTSATTTCRPPWPGIDDARRSQRCSRRSTSCRREAAMRWPREGFARRTQRASCAPPTCATSARRSRCACRCPTGRSTTSCVDDGRGGVPRRAPRAVRLRLPRRPEPAGRVGQPAGDRASARSASRSCRRGRAPADGRRAAARAGDAAGVLRRLGRRPAVYDRARLGAGDDGRPGRRCIEEFGSTVPVHPGFAARRRRLRQPAGPPRRR